MERKIYQFVLKIYGGEENWEKSRLKKIVSPIIRWLHVYYRTSPFYMKYNRGIFYRKTTLRVKKKSISVADYIRVIKDLFNVTIPQLECNVGMPCTLRCQKCNQCNFLLKDKHYFDTDVMIKNLSKVLSAVDFIHAASIAGGEALSAPNLERLIEYMSRSEKIGSVIVVTNGTVLPTEEVYAALKNEKVQLSVSNYPLVGEFRKNRDILYSECQKRGINVENNNEIDQWTDIGEPYHRKKSKLEQRETYAYCWLKDVSVLIEDKLYRCEKVYVLDNIGQRRMSEKDYVNVAVDDIKQIRKDLRKLYRIRTLDACNYCNNLCDRVIIPSGIQVEE